MRRQGVRPSRVTYTAAVAGLNRPRYKEWGPKLEKLARLLHDRSWKGDGEGGEGGDGPSPEDFDCSIEALGDAGDAGGAACLLRVMRQEGFHASPRAYRSVIYACARVGHLSEAMVLAKEMQSSSSVALAAAAAKGRMLASESAALPSLFPDSSQGVGVAGVGVGFGEGRGGREGVAVGVGLGVGLEVGEEMGGGEGDGQGVEIGVGVGEGEGKGKGKGAGNGIRVGVGEEEGVGEGERVEVGAREGEGEGVVGMGVGEINREVQPLAGAVAEDDPEDGSEFDIEVVYNCIISNFARAATKSGSNDNGSFMDICEHRTGRTSKAPEDKIRAVGARRRAVEAGAGAGAGAAVAVADTGRGGDGEGLVALLLGVAERAEGSLLDEGANGGVEVAAAEESPPSVRS